MQTITVEIHRGTIDPQGTGSDAECEAVASYLLDTVQIEFPGADVRRVGLGGRTDGGDDATTRDVRNVLATAWDEWAALGVSTAACEHAARARELAIGTAKLFAEENPGEFLDPAATDWDADAWGKDSAEFPVEHREDLWPLYQQALVAETVRLDRKASEKVDCLGACPDCGGTAWRYDETVTTTRSVRISHTGVPHVYGETIDAESGSDGRFVCRQCGGELYPTDAFAASIVWE
jgi:hypothetical protein